MVVFGEDLRENVTNGVRQNKKFFQIILIPLVVSIIPIVGQNQIASCAFVVIVMSTFWIVQCLPIAVTSLLPVFLYPIFGIMSSKELSPIYFHDNIMFIFASLMIGICIETSGLHQKLALGVCMIIGSQPKWILFGVILSTAFLSLWISNTATTSMMLPIVISLARNLAKLDPAFGQRKEAAAKKAENEYFTVSDVANMMKRQESQASGVVEIDLNEINADEMMKNEKKYEILESENVFETDEAKNLLKCLCLAIMYSSLIGGQASLIGTGSNIFLKGYFEKHHPNDALNFFTFMLYAMPIALVQIIAVWLLLGLMFLPKERFFNFGLTILKQKTLNKKSSTYEIAQKISNDPIQDIIRKKYRELGPFTWEQTSIGIYFIIAVLLWLTRDLYFVPGWSSLFKKGYLTDTSSAVLILFCIMVWPKENIFVGKPYEPMLCWNKVEKMFPWSIILLLGGSLAMAEGCEKSGLSNWMGDALQKVLPTNKYLCSLIIMIFSSFGTEFMSNISMISILLPILDKIAIEYGINHYFMLLPQAIAVNFAYMFPSATPSNAIIFGLGHLTLKDLIKCGLTNKLIGLVILFTMSGSWLGVIFSSESTNGFNQTTNLQLYNFSDTELFNQTNTYATSYITGF